MRGERLQHETVFIIENVAITAIAVADALADVGYALSVREQPARMLLPYSNRLGRTMPFSISL
jgi:hypothetical protein